MNNSFLHMLELVVIASLVNNFVFTRFLGLCIFFGVTRRMDTAVGMGITFTIVMVISAVVNWVAFTVFLVPLELTFLKIVVFIGVVAAFVQAGEIVLRKAAPALFHRLGIYLALISTNCIILAVPLINAEEGRTLLESVAFGLGSGLGFALALIIMASIREKLDKADVPAPFRGLPVTFIVTGLIALAFSAFSGLVKG
jgi:electron transport complex protein RnfA